MKPYNEKNLDGWSITVPVFEWILANIPTDSTVLEIGSGNGTKELCKYYKVFTIEENKKWLNIAPAHYIYAPIEPLSQKVPHSVGWYNESLFQELPKDSGLSC